MTNNIWTIFCIIAVILLVVFWNKRNVVWGCLALGIVIGSIIAIFFSFKGSGFDWSIIGKASLVGALLGFLAGLLGDLRAKKDK